VCVLCVLLVGGDIVRGQERSAAKVRRFRETAISPDGKRVAWVETLQGKDGTSSTPSAVFLADLGATTGKVRRITPEDESCTEHSLSSSPDGEPLAFLSNRGTKEQLQLYVVPAAPLTLPSPPRGRGKGEGGKAKRLTNLKGFLADPRWSPDGRQLGFLFTENALRDAGPVQTALVETGEIGQTVQYQRLSSVDLPTGKVRQGSPVDLYVYEYDWSPDGKRPG